MSHIQIIHIYWTGMAAELLCKKPWSSPPHAIQTGCDWSGIPGIKRCGPSSGTKCSDLHIIRLQHLFAKSVRYWTRYMLLLIVQLLSVGILMRTYWPMEGNLETQSSVFIHLITPSTTERNTLLDNIFISDLQHCADSGVLQTYYSYHNPVFCILT